MRKVARPGRWTQVGVAVLLGVACKTYVPDAARKTQRQIVDLTQKLELRLVQGKCLPSTMDMWMSEDVSVRRHAKDAWGGSFGIRADGRSSIVVSAGVDGVFGSDDDAEGQVVMASRGVPSCALSPHGVIQPATSQGDDIEPK